MLNRYIQNTKKKFQLNTLLIFLLIAVTVILSGCSTHYGQQKVSTSPLPNEFIDHWAVSMKDRIRGSLVLTNEYFFLSLSGGDASGKVEGDFVGIGKNGEAYFRFLKGKIVDNNRKKYKNVPTYSQVDGFTIKDTYARRGGRYSQYVISLTINGVPQNNFVGRLYKIRDTGNRGRINIRQDASFLYKDSSMGHTNRDRFTQVLDINNTSKRIQETINGVLHYGYNCGNVESLLVRPGRVSRMQFSGRSGKSLVKIISPLGNDRLMYAIRASSARLVARDGQFPSISFNKFLNKKVYLDFWLKPVVSDYAESASEVPVYIYYFSPQLLANARDCQFVKTTAFSKAFTLGKLYFAIMMENSRFRAMRNQNIIAEYISIYGRDTSISSALKDLFPMADQNTISFMTRNIGTLLQSKFDVESLEFANWRESVLQEIESRPGMRGEAYYRYGDILLDTSIFIGK